MKALSLWQPWASLMEIGVKTNETRDWKTNYRGDITICAAARPARLAELHVGLVGVLWDNRLKLCPDLREDDPITMEALLKRLPLGKALCVVNLMAMIETDNCFLTPNDEPVNRPGLFEKVQFITAEEYWSGNYSSGRWAWMTDTLRRVKPVPVKGAQGIFNLPPDVAEIIIKNYETSTHPTLS